MIRILFFSAILMATSAFGAHGLTSMDTGYTISKVRSARAGANSYIVTSSYEGTVQGIAFNGKIQWENKLSGFMNHDVWCEDLTGDGFDEILAANADGSVYCLNSKGDLLWSFKKNDAPMYAVCAVKKDHRSYVVCGGFDKSIYFLSPSGKLVKEIKSSTYTLQKAWGKKPDRPRKPGHISNFLRKIPGNDGNDVLLVQGSIHHASSTVGMYFFNPLDDKPFRREMVKTLSQPGDSRVVCPNGMASPKVIFGTSDRTNETGFSLYDTDTGDVSINQIKGLKNGYLVIQVETISVGDSYQYFVLAGNQIQLVGPELNLEHAEKLSAKYAWNDMWKDPLSGKILLGSSQSGGSCVHVIDPSVRGWKKAYEQISPPGKIQSILDNAATVKQQLSKFKRPAWERAPLPLYLMSESADTDYTRNLMKEIKEKYDSPIFLSWMYTSRVQSPDSWNRDALTNEKYRKARDYRRKYTMTEAQSLTFFERGFEDSPGLATWGGHGFDPYYFSLETKNKLVDRAKGKKTIFIYPEMIDHSADFEFVLDDLIYPQAEHAQGKNGNLYLRCKNLFWVAAIYMPRWNRVVSGEFSDVFVASQEETGDKTMEMSIAARLGMWSSGAVDHWGSRAVRDNPSYNRGRDFSYQMVPNCFLRMLIYHISSGATYINNFPVDQDSMSVLWELIAKGALYIPKRSEIVSFNPVHLSMKEPDPKVVEWGQSYLWATLYDEKFETENPFVLSRTNGSWPGAPVTEWDFSRYAAGVKERRLNFLPPYENGMVMITPPQKGIFADKKAPRGKLVDHLHPIYKGLMKEYITDGRHYYSSNGSQQFAADTYYKKIESDIKAGANKLPMTVSGDVAWVCAQTLPTHLRLTLIDSGYINPSEKTASVTFHTVAPKKITDLLSGQTFKSATSIQVNIPCGGFRFFDIEIKNAL